MAVTNGPRPKDDLPELLLADAQAWRAWLTTHHASAAGVWLRLAKKGWSEPTALRYEQALEEALCHGWIDGQLRRFDEATYVQRFTPRRRRSAWSQNNVAKVRSLIEEGRMRPAGLAAFAEASADGRIADAYAGQASITVPDDLTAALAAEPAAQAMFAKLSSQNRYAVLLRIAQAKRAETRARRIERFVAMLARGETPHPQKRGAG
jgi:uncharacterized protein YdeI (YjbR/CyaY-like superfamily)